MLFSITIYWLVFWLTAILYPVQCHEYKCPRSCNCSALSASCHGNNSTFVNVVKALPANLTSFSFTMFTPQLQNKTILNLKWIDDLDKFFNLRNFTIQPESQSKYFMYEISTLGHHRFCNWTHLEEIRLNAPMCVNPNAFSCLENLQVLDLSYTKGLDDYGLHKMLSVGLSRHTTTLLLRNIQILNRNETSVLDFMLLFLRLGSRNKIEAIDMSANVIRSVRPGLLFLPNLKRLDLSQNVIFGASTPITRLAFVEPIIHPSLRELILADQGINAIKHGRRTYPIATESPYELVYCDQTRGELLQLTTSHDKWNELCALLQWSNGSNGMAQQRSGRQNDVFPSSHSPECYQRVVLPIGKHLEILNISGLLGYRVPHANALPPGRYCVNPENNVRVIDASNNRLSQFIYSPTIANITVTGFLKLNTFILSDNSLTFKHFHLFNNMPSLQELMLASNKVQLRKDHANQMFKSLVNLRALDLSQTRMNKISYNEFAHLSNLKFLDLSGNKLHDLNITFPNSSSFQMLNISGNGMTFLEQSVVRELDSYQLLEVDIQDNDFICSCDSLWFIRWIQETRVKLTNKNTLDCFTDTGHTFISEINIEQFSKDCHPLTPLQIAVISTSASFCFFLLFFIGTFIYRRRWRIRHCWNRYRLLKDRIDLNDDFEYDAYISYSDDSPLVRRWVSGIMQEELERKRGLRLFIHQRDLLGFCLERTDVAMRKCRKTMLVLSPDFLRSWKCLYEAWSAHTSMVTEDRDAVVLVKLQPLPTGITGTLASLMQIRECLDWTEDPIGQNLFWEQLEDVLLSPSDNPIIN